MTLITRRTHFLLAGACIPFVPLIATAGDGPYLGIEGGVNWESPQNLDIDGTIVDRLHFADGWTAGVIAGYATKSGLRPELELDHRRNDVHRDLYDFSVSGSENADSAMANLWYDLKLPEGPLHVFHPYLGAGAGALRSDFRNVAIGGIGTSADHDTKFAWQAGAGVGVDVTRNVTVSADYRYLESNRGSFNVDISPAWQAPYRTQTALLSVRYSFGRPPSEAPMPIASTPPPPPPEPAPPPPPPVAVAPPPCQAPAGFRVDDNCHIIDQTLIVRAVDFEFNSVQLTAPARDTLNEVARALVAQPELAVEIEGYTDSIGSAAYNLKLSQRRAEAVKTYLTNQGVNAATLTAKGYGKDDPVASNQTAEGRAENRRVAFRVTHIPAHLQVINEGATEATTEAAEKNAEPAPRKSAP
jgi:OOP family OmpA-OmpF porin